MSEHVVSYRIKAIDDITSLQHKVNTLNKQSQTEFGRLGKKIDHVNVPTRRLLGNLHKVGSEGVKAPGALMAGFGKLSSFLSGPMLAAIGGVFAVQRVAAFGSSVVSTLSTFERYDAVLSNTLGSAGAAKKVMDDIVGLASTTPFEVDTLTDSWVRLANQGFKPTMNQMMSLGDLASSTGKDITMLSEAIIDAQVGENERLKEFGIQAKQSGNKTIFTFKGIQTVVERSASGIQKYLLSLGKLPGVQGAMNAISKTTGGLLSNLSDKYTQLKLTIGKGLKPVIEGVILFIGKLIDKFEKNAQWLLKNEAAVKKFTVNALTKLWAFIEKIGEGINAMIKFWDKNGKTIMEFAGIIAKVVPPIILAIMKVGAFVMKLYYIFYSTLYKVGKFFYDLGFTIGTIVVQIKNGFENFFGWFEEKIGIMADVIKYTLLLPLLPYIAILKGVKRIFNKGDNNQSTPSRITVNHVGFIPGISPASKNAPGGMAMSATGTDDRLLNLPGNKILQMTGVLPNMSSQGILARPSDEEMLYGKPKDPFSNEPGGKGKKLSDAATNVTGVKSGEIKNINININKLVETLMIKTEKLGMSTNQIKTAMTTILLDAVNDTQHSN